jgi:hypothetical protein
MLSLNSNNSSSSSSSSSPSPSLTSFSSSSLSNKTISREEWGKKLENIKIRKTDLNKIIMNYLIIEGYKDAAENFQLESGTQPEIDLNSILSRMAIRNAVQMGDIDQAIQLVNDLNPEILDRNPILFFQLKQQQLIELIRKGGIEEALEFAQEELAPLGEQNPQFLEELEKTMALLAFEDIQSIKLIPTSLSNLVDISHRETTASQLNAAILTSQCQEKDPKLPTLLKMLKWSQKQLESKIKFPKICDIITANLEEFHENNK